MLRLIIIAAALYLLYRILKGMLVQKHRQVNQNRGEIIDELVQDPNCKLYIPSRSSVKKVIAGRTYSFCSEECARKFEEDQGK
jgi:YHS domain-containing protein